MKDRKTKIAVISRSVRGGGSERFVSLFANNFCNNQEYDLILLTAEKQDNEYALDSRVKRVCRLSHKNLRKNIVIIHKFLKENEIDIALSVGVHENLCSCLANFLLKTQIVISERNAPKEDALSYKIRLLRWLFYRWADYYVFQTAGAQKFYSKKIQKRSKIIHNPVKNNLPERSDINKKEIIAIGRMHPQKDYLMLIHAFAEVHKAHPEYILKIYGEGEEKKYIKGEITNLGLNPYVILEGFFSELHSQIVDSDIYVMTSRFEGMPNALMEAMAMGFPVISTDCPAGGPRELIRNGCNGCLVPVGDTEMLIEKINFLIDNPGLKNELGNRAKKIRYSHDEKHIMLLWDDYFKAILKRNSTFSGKQVKKYDD